MQTETSDFIWGAAAIAAEIGVNTRSAFHLLERGLLPAKRVGRQWVASRARLRAFLLEDDTALAESAAS